MVFNLNQPTAAPPGLSSNSTFKNPSNQGNDPDSLSHLLEVQYGGIPFPCISFTENSSQDLAVHKYPNLDGARIELTGRNPSTYSCKAILANNIYPAAGENWNQGDLFPDVFEQILNKLYNSTTFGVLQHPFLGNRNVMPVKWDYSFIGKGPRDGVFLDITWIETIADSDILTTISMPSSLADLQSTGASLDTEYSSTPLQPFNPSDPTAPTITKLQSPNPTNLTLGQFFSKISGTIRNVASFPQTVIAPINAQILQISSSIQGAGAGIATSYAQLSQYGKSIVNQNKGLILHGPISNAYYYDKASNTPIFNIDQNALNNVYSTLFALNNNSNNNANLLIQSSMAFIFAMIKYYQSLQRVETANIVGLLFQFLGQLQSTLASFTSNNNNYSINTYVVMVPTTLFALSKNLNNSIGQLLQLNSQLNKLYIVPDATVIQYYQA